MKKIKVGILFGGKSAEHEVSLQSAKNVIEALDKNRYEPILIGIDKQGRWLLNEASQFLLNAQNPKLIALNQSKDFVALVPQGEGKLVNINDSNSVHNIDVVFPILHGPCGEDGTIQGLLKLANIPYVGSGVLGSAVGMDKDVMKRLLRDAKIPIANFIVCKPNDIPTFNIIVEQLGLPFFIKPANMGSSVGVSKVKDSEDFDQALALAFQYDNKIIIEEFILGREIECAVLGNTQVAASIPGEIIPTHEFYSYAAKYIDEKGAALEIPAKLSENLTKSIQALAIKTFNTLCAEGMARVDFFLQKDGSIFVNEINTIPGFTSISMYPKLWEASGIPYAELIERLIKLAFERFEQEDNLQTNCLSGIGE